jgi:hypothetical protein
MTRQRRVRLVASSLAFVMVMALTAAMWPAGVTAQDGSRMLRVFSARCPADDAVDPTRGECDGTPNVDVVFHVGRPMTDFYITGRTNTAGIVAFPIEDLPLNGTIRLIQELPPGTARFVAFCFDEAGAPLAITYEDFPENEPPIGVAAVDVGEEGDARCDWYTAPPGGTSGYARAGTATPAWAPAATPAATPSE